ncbi:hypothetical protein VNI00_009165 [Paramarasmius palmivorus]|uniref:Uncharacterized protein n=1 Tax=Paramarasmius palmivorus TaxID=297713 RepID=A0AAW0CS99_9AGAR
MADRTQWQNFGDTLSSRIQDIAALLPLLGTQQCEFQVGSSLEKGYVYAAASTLSLFGSLGITGDDKDTGFYGAEVKLRKLLEEQHIDDPNLVLEFDWSGWKHDKSTAYEPMEAMRNQGYWDDGDHSFSVYVRATLLMPN